MNRTFHTLARLPHICAGFTSRPGCGFFATINMSTENEVWKAVNGYEGFYEVSNQGNIRSLDRFVDNGNGGHIRKGQSMKPSVNAVGYRTVTLRINGGGLKKQLSRLVAAAFIENPENKKEVNHISGIKTQDNVENLEWVTPSENLEHAKRTGLNHNYGDAHHWSILTEEQVKEIRSRYIPHKVKGNQLAKEYGVSRQAIYDIVHNRNWKRTSI